MPNQLKSLDAAVIAAVIAAVAAVACKSLKMAVRRFCGGCGESTLILLYAPRPLSGGRRGRIDCGSGKRIRASGRALWPCRRSLWHQPDLQQGHKLAEIGASLGRLPDGKSASLVVAVIDGVPAIEVGKP